MARTRNKQRLVEELFTLNDFDLIEGVANLVMKDQFTVQDVLKHFGKKKSEFINGFSMSPINDKLPHTMICYLSDNKDIISLFTLGGHLKYTLEELIQHFGEYTAAFSTRDEMTMFYFKQLPKKINAAELQFIHFDLVYDKSKNEIYELKNGQKQLLRPIDINFNHFTLAF